MTPNQRRVLIALLRPLKRDERALPASNDEIARTVSMSVPNVKRNLGELYKSFGIHLPANCARQELCDRTRARYDRLVALEVLIEACRPPGASDREPKEIAARTGIDVGTVGSVLEDLYREYRVTPSCPDALRRKQLAERALLDVQRHFSMRRAPFPDRLRDAPAPRASERSSSVGGDTRCVGIPSRAEPRMPRRRQITRVARGIVLAAGIMIAALAGAALTDSTPEAVGVARETVAAINSGELERLKPLLTPGALLEEVATNRRVRGPEQFNLIGGWRTTFPDLHADIKRVFQSGEHRVALELVWRGTQTGPLKLPCGTVPPSGRTVELPAILVLNERNGQIYRSKHFFDLAGLLRALHAVNGKTAIC